MYPGISTQIFHREKLAAPHAQAMREAGFEAAEVYTYPGHFNMSDLQHAKGVRRVFDDCGLGIASLHAPFFDARPNMPNKGHLSISHTNKRVRLASIDTIRQCAETAHVLGARVIVVHFGDGGDKNTHAVIESLFSSIIHIEEVLLGSDISVAYENIDTPTSLCGYISHMLDRYEIRNAGVCLDIGHANINEDPATAVERSGGRLIHVHASDNNGRDDQHNPPFLGAVRWDRVMPALYSTSYDGCFIFEPRFQPEPLKLLKHLVDTYKKLMDLAQGLPIDESDQSQSQKTSE